MSLVSVLNRFQLGCFNFKIRGPDTEHVFKDGAHKGFIQEFIRSGTFKGSYFVKKSKKTKGFICNAFNVGFKAKI